MNTLIGKDTSKDAIVAYLRDRDSASELSAKQQQLLDSMTDAYTLIRNYNSVPDAIQALVKLSQKQGIPISRATARRYIYDALDVFGNVSVMKREAIRHLTTEIIMDAIAIARDQNDPKTMIQGAKELATLNGSDDPDAPNFAALEPHVIQMMLDPEVLKLLTLLAGRGTIDLDTLTSGAMNSMAEDATIETNDAGI